MHNKEFYIIQPAEPAFLVATPSRPVHLSGGRISMTCVAFGAPFPDIVWSSSSQGINDYRNEDNPRINVYTFNLTDPTTGFLLRVSVLELCDATYNDSLVTDYRCTAVNGLSGSGRPRLGENTAVFDIRPMGKWKRVHVLWVCLMNTVVVLSAVSR